MKRVLPLEDRVLVKIVKEEEKTPSGIILPDVAKGETSDCRSYRSRR